MKIRTLLTCLLTFVFLNTYSQAYIPFVQEGKMWTEKWASAGNPNITGISTYLMNGDTIINSLVYKKIIYNASAGIFFFLKEDTLTKKVFLMQNNGYEYLLYDFNLQIGDTLQGFDCIIVLNVTTEHFAGKTRKKYIFDGFSSLCWYEGIGSNLQGVFEPKCIVGSEITLLCYYENDSLLYHNESINDNCFILTNKTLLETKSNLSNYFSDDVLYIKTEDEKYYSLMIYDIYGKMVNENNFSGNLEMNLSYLPSGMYIYKITCQTTKQEFVNKIIKS